MCKVNVRQSVNANRDFEQQLEDYYDFLINESGYDPDDSSWKEDIIAELEEEEYVCYFVVCRRRDNDAVEFVDTIHDHYDEAEEACRHKLADMPEGYDYYYDTEPMTANDLHRLNFIGY